MSVFNVSSERRQICLLYSKAALKVDSKVVGIGGWDDGGS